MANISKKVTFDILEKLADGTFKHKLPSTNIDAVEDLRLNSKGKLEYYDGGKWIEIIDYIPYIDTTGSPGPSQTIGGDKSAGYFGTVPASDLFTGSEIASAVGITEGTAQFNDTGWLKFVLDGKIVFKSQKPYRHSIGWDHIDSKGAVDGTKTVTKEGTTYRVRLLWGVNKKTPVEEHSGTVNHHSEWNRLMLPISEHAPDRFWHPRNVDSPTEDWGVNFTNEDLHTYRKHGEGTYQWCQGSVGDGRSKIIRGYEGVSFSFSSISAPLTQYGWSPVLEVVQ